MQFTHPGKILKILVGTILCSYLVLLVVLNAQPLKNIWVEKLEQGLSEAMGTKVELADVEIGLFNRVVLDGVAIYDQSGEHLLDAKKIAVKILLRDLIKDRITLRSVLIMDAQINLYQEHQNAAPNYKFITDLFQSDNSAEEGSKFGIGSFTITRANISYDNKWVPKVEGMFSTDHIQVKNICTNFALNEIADDSINVRVRNFSCEESCGLAIEKLNFSLEGNKKTFLLHNFQFKTTHSELTCEEPVTFDIENFKQKIPFINGKIWVQNFSTKDIEPFLSHAKQLNLNFSGSAQAYQSDESHTAVEINIKEKKNHFTLNVNSLLNFTDHNRINIERLFADSTLLTGLAHRLLNTQEGKLVSNLKQCAIKGYAEIDLNKKEGEAQFKINSPITNGIDVSAQKNNDKINLSFSADELNIQSWLDNNELPNTLTFSANAIAAQKDSLILPETLFVSIENISKDNGLHLRDIEAKAIVSDNNYDCQIKSNTPELTFNIDASCNYKDSKFSNIFIQSQLDHADFVDIGIKDSIFNGVWMGNASLHIPYITQNKLDIELNIDSLSVKRVSNSYDVNRCSAVLKYAKNKPSQLNVLSDFVSISAEGILDCETILEAWSAAITQHAPVYALNNDAINNIGNKSSMSFHVNIHKGDLLEKITLIPLKLTDGSTIQGKLNKGDLIAEIVAHSDNINYDNTEIENLSLHFKSNSIGAGLLLQGRKQILNDNVQFVVGAQLHDNILENNIEWKGIENRQISGNLNTITSFITSSNIVSSILPTSIHVGDSTWNVSKGEIIFQDNKYRIENLTINTDHQKLTFNGGVSSESQDSLHIALDKINVGNILDKINFRSVLFDGMASGNAYLSFSPNRPLLRADLQVESFLFNRTLFGNANIKATWNSPKDRINIGAEFIEQGVGNTNVMGYVSPAENGLDLQVTSNNTNLAFLRYWVNNITQDIDGRTTGYVHLYGPFNKLDFDGSMNIDATMFIPANGGTYRIDDAKVLISPGKFQMEKSKILSPKGGSGTITALLKHQNLKKFSYELDLEADHLLLYDKKRSIDMPFYATAYASGNVELIGNPNLLTLNINATPTDNSIIVYTESEVLTSQETSDGFITYRNADKHPKNTSGLNSISAIHTPSIDMNMNFRIEMNPSATLRVLMDEITGDHLNLRGTGTLTADYYNKGTFQLFGNYAIQSGNYQMSIQDVLKKNFEIQSGSNIAFGGNPDEAQLSLKAIYTVPTASLADLNIGDNFSDRKIKADCILNIGGKASSPTVSFDLDLPNINDDEKQMVRKLIATEEDLNMQVIHLLGLGRFYTYDYSLTESYNKQSQSTLAANSFLSSTISSQINEVITSAIGSKNWSFGTNLSTGTSGWSDMEVDGIVSGKLFNNRLHLNGNIGYHENQYNAMRGSNVVGDFDVKYLLNPNGNFYLKAYSETNDRYFTKSALTTQGLGILLQIDFMNIKELFKISKDRKQSTKVEIIDTLNSGSK